MPRIRTIKPEWLEDERLCTCSDAARVLSVALISLADDEGRGRLGITTGARVWPTKPAKLDSAIRELSGWYLDAYEVRGQAYYQLRNWSKHQRINRATPSRLPPFTESSVRPHGSLTEDSRTDQDQDQDQDQGSGIKDPISAPNGASSPSRATQVRLVFDCWLKHHAIAPDRCKLTADRRKRIESRLRAYTAEQLCEAIIGATKDPWTMGTAEKSERAFNDLSTILKTEEKTERMIALYHGGRRGGRGIAPVSDPSKFRDETAKFEGEHRNSKQRTFDLE